MQDATPQDILCPICQERHPLSISYSVKYPYAASLIPPEEIESRIVMTPDQCVIDGTKFYLRGRIAIPVHGLEEPFIWGLWVEVSPKNFVLTNELWNTEGRETMVPPFRGYINNELLIYGNTLDLEVDVHTYPVGERPRFTVVNPTHTIAREQREGLSMAEVEEIAIEMWHPDA